MNPLWGKQLISASILIGRNSGEIGLFRSLWGGNFNIESPYLPFSNSFEYTAIMAVGTASLQDRLEIWAQRLNNLTVSPLTRDYPDTKETDGKRVIEAFESLRFPKEKLEASSSGFTAFLTAFIILVARLTGDEDIAVGTNSNEDGRAFVIRVPIDASESFAQLYTKVDKVRIYFTCYRIHY